MQVNFCHPSFFYWVEGISGDGLGFAGRTIFGWVCFTFCCDLSCKPVGKGMEIKLLGGVVSTGGGGGGGGGGDDGVVDGCCCTTGSLAAGVTILA